MTQEVFAEKIRNWAEARNLLTPDNAVKQAAKMGEEIGEVIGAIVKGNAEAIKMELGDIEVVGAILAAQIGHDDMVLALAQPHPSGDVFRQLSLMQLNGYSLLDAALDFLDSGKTSGRHKLEDELYDILGCSRGLMKMLGFDEDECRGLVWDKITNRTGKTANGVFIKDAPSPELGWIPTAERPLVQPTPSGGWITTEDGDDDFLAAVPYQDANYPAQDLWWIKHCVIEESGLCIVGEDYNEPAGWDVDAVDYFLPITPPSPKS